jgi:hypothetical protein
MRETMERCSRMNLMCGEVTDVREELSSSTGNEILVLEFPVIDTLTGNVLSARGMCKITMDGDSNVTRVHSYYDGKDGDVVDIYVDGSANSTKAKGQPIIVDAEVVTPKKQTRKHT